MTPSPSEILHARKAAALTQTQAAAVVYYSLRQWQQYEAGTCDMHPAVWELFQIKTAAMKAVA